MESYDWAGRAEEMPRVYDGSKTFTTDSGKNTKKLLFFPFCLFRVFLAFSLEGNLRHEKIISVNFGGTGLGLPLLVLL